MAKITREQFEKWNAQAKNGFEFDLRYYLTWNEKVLTKKIKLENGNIIEFKLMYKNEYKSIVNEYGCRWNQETGRQIPYIHITEWKPSHNSETFYSSGMGKWEQVGEPQNSKKYNILCKISAEINTKDFMVA